jgi:hypothetical protein
MTVPEVIFVFPFAPAAGNEPSEISDLGCSLCRDVGKRTFHYTLALFDGDDLIALEI